jgi:dipeptidyl aminopeptidase/acylaminoacyl peptidase
MSTARTSGSEQLFISLLAARVETEFVRCPGQSHLMPWFGPAEYRIDYSSRLVAWFDRFLKD